MTTTEFRETSEPSAWDPRRRELLSRRISELALTIYGTRLDELIEQLYRELDERGIAFKPKCYLSDEWGCPHGVPVIGIPFYLADPELSRLEGELTGIEAETDDETMMYLRHETGHALNYAYLLYEDPEWRKLFGPYSRPYSETYKPDPLSARFVRHIPGWYAQKHPDEDFAETFAVWLTPGSNWREQYADTPALTKLLYVDRIMREIGQKPPLVADDTFDMPVEELEDTLEEWYGTGEDANRDGVGLPLVLNGDLRTLFPATEGQPAAELLRRHRRRLIHDVNYWTGVNRHLLTALIDEVLERVRTLDLKVAPDQTEETMIGLATFLTTLAMNYRYTDRFVQV